MNLLLVLLFVLGYSLLAYTKPKFALAVLFGLLPTYLIRFPFLSLPSTLLEVMIGIVSVRTLLFLCLDTSFRIEAKERIRLLKYEPWLLFVTGLFLLGASLGVYYSIETRAALGEWKAFYIEPVIVAFLTFLYTKTKKDLILLFDAFLLCGFFLGLYALLQRLTGFGVPYAFWENGASYRVTGWYGFPNAVGHILSAVAILSLGLFQTISKEEPRVNFKRGLLLIVGVLAFLGILFAKSTGGLMAVLAGVGVYLLFKKRARLPLLIIVGASFISLLLLPKQNSLRQELLAENRSGQIRVAMWKETLHVIGDDPVRGAGLASYKYRVLPYHEQVNGQNIEIFHHPHNIFLTMWVNLGLIGLLGFIGIIAWVTVRGIQLAKKNIPEAAVLLAIGAGFMMAGLVDSPYIKNDLSILFWVLPASILILKYERTL